VIDLHLHTTASDGRSAPGALVSASRRAGLSVISITDHDTVAALDEAAASCAAEGIRLVAGIEITAGRDGVEVHVLGYFFDRSDARLLAFLESQRADRVRRITAMIERLHDLGLGVDEAEILGRRHGGRAVGRPLVARAMVQAGHVRTAREAFDQYLAEGRPAFVPRRAPTPEAVFAVVHDAGGIAALAHPALLARDEWIPDMAAAGLDAIEGHYIEHPPALVSHYVELASRCGLAVSGGSDYHGDVRYGPQRPGDVVLPPDAFERLEARARRRQAERRPALSADAWPETGTP
jgi:predicted metal-dependent phosphoesterase TrpH